MRYLLIHIRLAQYACMLAAATVAGGLTPMAAGQSLQPNTVLHLPPYIPGQVQPVAHLGGIGDAGSFPTALEQSARVIHVSAPNEVHDGVEHPPQNAPVETIKVDVKVEQQPALNPNEQAQVRRRLVRIIGTDDSNATTTNAAKSQGGSQSTTRKQSIVRSEVTHDRQAAATDRAPGRGASAQTHAHDARRPSGDSPPRRAAAVMQRRPMQDLGRGDHRDLSGRPHAPAAGHLPGRLTTPAHAPTHEHAHQHPPIATQHSFNEILENDVVQEILNLTRKNIELEAEMAIQKAQFESKLRVHELELRYEQERAEKMMREAEEVRREIERDWEKLLDERERLERHAVEARELQELAERKLAEAREQELHMESQAAKARGLRVVTEQALRAKAAEEKRAAVNRSQQDGDAKLKAKLEATIKENMRMAQRLEAQAKGKAEMEHRARTLEVKLRELEKALERATQEQRSEKKEDDDDRDDKNEKKSKQRNSKKPSRGKDV